jgi:hypothetical protein
MKSPAQPAMVVRAYYAATAVFVLLDYGAHVNVRVAFLDPYPLARLFYYGFCFACLVLMLWRPAWTTLVGTVESLITIIALIFSMALGSMIVTDQMIETGTGFVTGEEIVNFVIAGAAAWYSWVTGLRKLGSGYRE